MSKLLWLIPLALAAIIGSQWQDIKRYWMIRQLSAGQGHPEYVPVRGSTAYPHSPNGDSSLSAGDFDQASQGGSRPGNH